METGVSLCLGTPAIFVQMLGHLFGENPQGFIAFSLPAWIGVLGLVLGLVLAVSRRDKRLLWLLLPLLVTQVFLFAAGLLRDQVDGPILQWTLSGFLLAQIVLTVLLILRLKGARLPAAGLGVFGLSYAWTAQFIASMSFSGAWL